MAFVLGGKQSAAYWDKVVIPVRKEVGGWADLTLEVKFKRWKQADLDAWMESWKDAVGEQAADETQDAVSRPEMQRMADRILEYMEDWKVADANGQPVALTRETLQVLLDEFPGAGRRIGEQFVSSTYGQREKN